MHLGLASICRQADHGPGQSRLALRVCLRCRIAASESDPAEHASEVAYLFNTLDASYGEDASEKDRRRRALSNLHRKFREVWRSKRWRFTKLAEIRSGAIRVVELLPIGARSSDLIRGGSASILSKELPTRTHRRRTRPPGLGGTSWQM